MTYPPCHVTIRIVRRWSLFAIPAVLVFAGTAHSLPLHVDGALWARYHYGPNTLQLAPGVVAGVSLPVSENIELRGHLFSGMFIGYATGLAVDVNYTLQVGAWTPGAGLSVSVALGDVIFHTQSAVTYLYPAFPEIGAGVVVIPLRFRWQRAGVSFLEFVVGTDALAPGQIVLVDLMIVAVSIAW